MKPLQRIHGWGRYPIIEAEVNAPLVVSGVKSAVANFLTGGMIARGLGRSYGDSSLAKCVIDTRYLNHLLDFDKNTGIVTCNAGISHGWRGCFERRAWQKPSCQRLLL
jgi:decaprenylphospho-beta-D-ribofuranose 2-oxidase